MTLATATSVTSTFTAPTVTSDTALTFTLVVTDENDGSVTDSVTVTVTPPTVNQPPTANAGADQTVNVGARVALDGTGSTDSDGSVVQYAWTQESGPAVLLQVTPSTAATPFFIAPAPGIQTALVFRLEVTDNADATATDTVTVTVNGQILTGRRDRLLLDWATSEGNVCGAYNALDYSAREVFVWNTHRLYITDLLSHVDGLHAIYGKNYPDQCGGIEHNRTYMSMTEELNAKLVLAAKGDDDIVPGWRETQNFACTNPSGLGECPHIPFQYQVETRQGVPTAQIQLFDASRVRVERRHYNGTNDALELIRSCGTNTILMPESDICNDPNGCYGDEPVGACTRSTTYQDTVTWRPSNEYSRGPSYDRVTIADSTSFEMDQDYEVDHDSAPSCGAHGQTAANLYAVKYGDPNWNWQPSACTAARQAGAAFTHTSISAATTLTRVVHVTELRARIDGLRIRFGVAAFSWTDETISPTITPVRAVHMTELRTALNAAYVAAGRTAPTYTDSAVVAGVTPIKAVHITELRSAVFALEQHKSTSEGEDDASQG